MGKKYFKVLDVLAMQECLEGYKKLVEWIPPKDIQEEDLKANRLRIIDYLSDMCEDFIVSQKGS